MPPPPALLARGPWALDDIDVVWHDEHYAPPDTHTQAADEAIAALKDRGSPSHDGHAARLIGHSVDGGRLRLELQPVRWALRLVEGDASASMASLCIVRDSEGRWLAGRRAAWLSTWPERWALGAGGAVDLGESPVATLARELREEWALEADHIRGEALIRLPHQLVMFIGQAWVPAGAPVVRDHEHDDHAWWPADIGAWPAEADEQLRRVAALLDAPAP